MAAEHLNLLADGPAPAARASVVPAGQPGDAAIVHPRVGGVPAPMALKMSGHAVALAGCALSGPRW